MAFDPNNYDIFEDDQNTAQNYEDCVKNTKGGTAGQVLTKDSGDDHVFSWQDPTGGAVTGIYDTVAAMVADAANLSDGDVVQLQGYYSGGDGAEHLRKISTIDDGTGIAVGANFANVYDSQYINVSWLGAVDSTSDISTLLNAIYALPDLRIIRADRDFLCGASTSISKIEFINETKLYTNSVVTLTIDGVIDTELQIFDLFADTVVNLAQSWVRPDWWGDVERSLNYAVDALPVTGGTIKLLNRRYKPNYHVYGYAVPADAVYFSKDNLHFEGAKMPQLSDDYSLLEDGTILAGWILNWCNNVKYSNLGIDCGQAMVTTYPGIGSVNNTENLWFSYPDDTVKAANGLKKGVQIHNTITLMSAPAALGHAMLFEGYENVSVTGDAITCMGTFGFVIKCSDLRADTITTMCHSSQGLFLKSDSQVTAQCKNISIDKHIHLNDGFDKDTPYSIPNTEVKTLYLNPENGSLKNIYIGSTQIKGTPWGVYSQYGTPAGTTMEDIRIDNIMYDGAGKPVNPSKIALRIISQNDHEVTNFSIGNLITEDSLLPALVGLKDSDIMDIDNIICSNTSVYVAECYGGFLNVGNFSESYFTGSKFWNLTGTGQIINKQPRTRIFATQEEALGAYDENGVVTFAVNTVEKVVRSGKFAAGTSDVVAPAFGSAVYTVVASNQFGAGNDVRSCTYLVQLNNEATAVASVLEVGNFNTMTATFSVSGGKLQVTGMPAGSNRLRVSYF